MISTMFKLDLSHAKLLVVKKLRVYAGTAREKGLPNVRSVRKLNSTPSCNKKSNELILYILAFEKS